MIVNKMNDIKYGGSDARDMLNLPPYAVKVKPGSFGEWRIFVQSTSVNRKLIAGTTVFVEE